MLLKPIPVAALRNAWVCGRSLAGTVVSNPAGVRFSFVCVVVCQVEVSLSDRSIVQRSPTDCGVSECDHEALIVRPWLTTDCAPRENNILRNNILGRLYLQMRYACT